MYQDYRLSQLLNIPIENIQDWSGDANLAIALVRQHCKGCYLHVKVGAKISAWIAPHPTEPVPQDDDTIAEAICLALEDWLKGRAKYPQWTPQDSD